MFYTFFVCGMAIFKVKKRNGSIVSFERTKIEEAITKAIEAVGGTDFSRVSALTDKIIVELAHRVGKNIPDIEAIQDVVEYILIKE